MQYLRREMRFALPLLLLLTALSGTLRAQSLDIGAPSPVPSSELSGRVLARDIGDARFTNHYYAFTGNPGDLIITIETTNLNGDIDLFTAGALRPLMKFSIYAESTAPVTKGIFLRNREDLILRVEARSPNDDEGTYQIRFAGSFEPIARPSLSEEATTTEESPAVASGDKKVRRVTSSGARIYEPEPPPAEVAAVPTPEPTPEPVAEPERTPTETPANVEEKPAETPSVTTTTPRSSRTRRPSSRRARPRPPVEPARPKEEVATGTETTTEPQEEVGPRLVIETRDGTLINRSMMTVRRVMVENGQVVVVGRDGKVQRVQLVDVVKMTIAP